MSGKATDQVTTIGIDIGKNNFHLIGLDGAGEIVLRRKQSRSQMNGKAPLHEQPQEGLLRGEAQGVEGPSTSRGIKERWHWGSWGRARPPS